MAFEGTLNVDGNAYNINWMLLQIARNEDQRGKPASRPAWGVHISLDAMDDSTIKNWMIDPNMQKEGKIILSRIDESATFKEIEFKNAFCLNYADEFFSDVEYLNTVIFITGGEVTFNKATLRV
ncbi:type VI secretion system tube protein TssD [Nibrella viscosa]|uniref:Type VI secretion system tube protein TssD n=1 Tax=Nibrella viscosa TaxID=1084524 RepID=A0ABP8JT78_9BACT